MNPMQELYESTLESVKSQLQAARSLNKEARLEWYREVNKLLQHEMAAADYQSYDSDGF